MCEIMTSLLLLCALVSPILAQNGPIVATSQGRVIGLTASDGSHHMFYGIPYAGNPSGNNRFKAPTPVPNFPGDFHATDSSRVCAQPTRHGFVGVEDCLYLNIITKNLTPPKPVIVWIDGEDYTNNREESAQYSFKKLVERDVVVVSINYRLSIFGFLCLGVEEAPGNAGLKDIIAGLRWIKENIAGFGGNPDNVVLFGHGSGAAVADLVSLSPLAQNLFHKVIASSGNAIAPWAVAYNPVQYAEMFGAKLGYTEKSKEELALSFVNTDFTVLGNYLSGYSFLNNTALFAPCIENVALNNTVLSEAPINIIRSGNYSHVPYITGYTNREGTFRTYQALYDDWLGQMQNNFTDSLQVDLKPNSTTNHTDLAQTIRQFYFGADPINLAAIEDYFDYEGDSMFLVSTLRVVRERALTSQAPVRLYEFQYRGTRNSEWTFTGVAITGARHGSVLNYLFDYDLAPGDVSAQDVLLTRWVTFAHTGVPTTGTGNAVINWNPVTVTAGVPTINYLKLEGGEVAANQSVIYQVPATAPHEQRRVFWDGIYASHYVPPSPVSNADKIIGLSFLVVVTQIGARLL